MREKERERTIARSGQENDGAAGLAETGTRG